MELFKFPTWSRAPALITSSDSGTHLSHRMTRWDVLQRHFSPDLKWVQLRQQYLDSSTGKTNAVWKRLEGRVWGLTGDEEHLCSGKVADNVMVAVDLRATWSWRCAQVNPISDSEMNYMRCRFMRKCHPSSNSMNLAVPETNTVTEAALPLKSH